MIDLIKACTRVRIKAENESESWVYHTWSRSELCNLAIPDEEIEKAIDCLESSATDYWLEYYMPCDDRWYTPDELADIAKEPKNNQ